MWITHTWMKCWHINFYATRIRIILAFTYEWVCVASHASFVFCFLFLVFCVLGNICHKLPEVLYRLSRLLHIFARNHFSSGEQMPWHYWNFLLFFFAVFCFQSSVFGFPPCFVFTYGCLCGPDNNPLCGASILHQSISKCSLSISPTCLDILFHSWLLIPGVSGKPVDLHILAFLLCLLSILSQH